MQTFALKQKFSDTAGKKLCSFFCCTTQATCFQTSHLFWCSFCSLFLQNAAPLLALVMLSLLQQNAFCHPCKQDTGDPQFLGAGSPPWAELLQHLSDCGVGTSVCLQSLLGGFCRRRGLAPGAWVLISDCSRVSCWQRR